MPSHGGGSNQVSDRNSGEEGNAYLGRTPAKGRGKHIASTSVHFAGYAQLRDAGQVRSGSTMFNSLGFFEDPKSDLTVLHSPELHQSLRRGGVLVIETLGKELMGRRFQPTTSSIGSDGSLLVLRHAIIDDWTRTSEDWILLQRGRVYRFRFEYTLYSGQELREMLGDAGFGQVVLFGDFDGREYGLGASRLVAVARKSD
jgi:hypothetical protein